MERENAEVPRVGKIDHKVTETESCSNIVLPVIEIVGAVPKSYLERIYSNLVPNCINQCHFWSQRNDFLCCLFSSSEIE